MLPYDCHHPNSPEVCTTRSVLDALGDGGSIVLGGGRLVTEFAKTDRILGEMLGLIGAVVVGGIGFVVKSAADNLDPDGDDQNPQ